LKKRKTTARNNKTKPGYVDGYVLAYPKKLAGLPPHGEGSRKGVAKMPFDMKRMVYGGFKIIVDS
jgi:hypothetical protein